VEGHKDFEFNLTFGGAPLKVWADGYYSHTHSDLDMTVKNESNGSRTYIIRQVTEPWTIHFGPESASGEGDGNEAVEAGKVWAYKNILYINALTQDVVSIYNITGVLNKKVEIPAGLNKITLDKGIYVVTLKDGKVYKIVIQ
jgi:hypothetical protein